MISLKKRKNLFALVCYCYGTIAFGAYSAFKFYIKQDEWDYSWAMTWFTIAIILAVMWAIYKPILLTYKQRKIKKLLWALHIFKREQLKLKTNCSVFELDPRASCFVSRYDRLTDHIKYCRARLAQYFKH